MADRSVDIEQIQARLAVHNNAAAKYRHQVEILRDDAQVEAEIWEVVLSQLFVQAIDESTSNGTIPDEVLEAVLAFGFQCMGVGAVMAMDGLAQETIVI